MSSYKRFRTESFNFAVTMTKSLLRRAIHGQMTAALVSDWDKSS